MKILLYMLAGAVLLGTGAMVYGDDEASEQSIPETLQDYLHCALSQNAGLQSAFSRYKAAMAQVPQAGALQDPMFTYGYFIEKVETRVGPQQHRFGLMQTFPWFGTLSARTDAAAAAARAAGRRFDAARLDVIEKTKTAYVEFAYLGRAVAIAEANLELLKHFEQVVSTRYRTAGASHPDIIRSQIELAILEDEMVTLRRQKKPVVARVNAVLNRAPALDLPWPAQEPLSEAALDEAQIIAAIMDYNPDLSALSFEIAAARSRIELAQKRSRPNITLGVDWIQTGSARMPNTPGSGRDPIIAMVSINLPIWTGSYDAGVEQARSAARGTVESKAQLQSDLAARAAELMFAVEDSDRKLTLYRDVLIPKAKEMLDVSEQAYRTGEIDFLSLIDAQRKLLEFELVYERFAADHLVSLAQLEAMVGGFVPPQRE